MSKSFYIITIIFFISLKGKGQHTSLDRGFGEGIVSIGQFGFSDQDHGSDDPASLAAIRGSYNFVYFVKGNKILRDDFQDMDSLNKKPPDTINTIEGLRTTLKIGFVHPRYLIDWQQKMVYIFYKKKGRMQIAQRSLQEDSTEIFYRLIDENGVSDVRLLNDRPPVTIVNKKCLQGIVNLKGENIVFYYTIDSVKVHSPLNGFVPSNFPYQVLRVEIGSNLMTSDGKSSKGTIIFQVTNIEHCKLEDTLFSLPGNIVIQKNVPLNEIYFPE